MIDHRFNIALRRLLILLLLLASAVAWSQDNYLFSAARTQPASGSEHYLAHPATKSINYVAVNPLLVSDKTHQLTLNLPSGELLVARQQRFQHNPDGTELWEGNVTEIDNAEPAAESENAVLLVRDGNNISGDISVNGRLFAIVPLGHGQHALTEMDASMQNGGDELAIGDEQETAGILPLSRNLSSTTSVIRVAVVTTNQVRSTLADIPGQTALAVAYANQGFKNSRVNIIVENAGILNANFNESGTAIEMLAKVSNPTDQNIGAAAKAFREEKLADVVVLLTASANGSCGGSYSWASKEEAFAVLPSHWSCANFVHRLGVRIGLIIGAGFSRGYIQNSANPQWGTLLTANCLYSCERINYWSNPEVNYHGLPTGTAAANNALVLNQRRQQVADFMPDPPWIPLGILYGDGDLPPRQLYQIDLKNSAIQRPIDFLDVIIDKVGQNDWPSQVARAVNAHFASNVLRAGEMNEAGDIHFINGSHYRNSLWFASRLKDAQQLDTAWRTYAVMLNDKWLPIGAIEAKEAGIPGSQKQVVLRNSHTGQELARISMTLNADNQGQWTWPFRLANTLNNASQVSMRAGELLADGSVATVGSAYRNLIWVPLAGRRDLSASVETVGWQQRGELKSSSNLPARQFFQMQLKDTSTGQLLSAYDWVVASVDINLWPAQAAQAINAHLPNNVVRAGELQSNGEIKVAEGSAENNKIWINYTGKEELELSRHTYAEALNQQWFNIGRIQSFADATPGTQKEVVLRDAGSNEVLARISLPINDNNKDQWRWPFWLAGLVNEHTSKMRAGQREADGSISVVPGSSYLNLLWVPLAQYRQLNASVETFDWQQVGELYEPNDLPARQFFQLQLQDQASGQIETSLDIVVVDPEKHRWPEQIARVINNYFPANTLRAGERRTDGSIHIYPGSHYRNKLWLNAAQWGKQLNFTRYTYAEFNQQKWFSIGNISASADAVAGTAKELVLRDNSNHLLARFPLFISDSNKASAVWPRQLAQLVNLFYSQQPVRAGQLQDDGSVQPVADHNGNRVWVPLDQRQNI
ncbi:hypothetical protein [Pantoea sp. B65]|uniref:hypothetical protein n=1 Tax=Pantoea sp. B65 TaxID=2813359 RepID=UPI0039B55BF3